MQDSIFKEFYSDLDFSDKYNDNPSESVDVIIPIVHTNELWAKNLISFYREIPIHSLFIGDGGCIDDSIQIVKKFPRVKIFDHSKYTSLGYSLKELIRKVSTDWFVYLHSDVYLPSGWFEAMKENKSKFDWFESNQRLTVLAEIELDYDKKKYHRPLSGSQMGKTSSLIKSLASIEDDYLYRNEDIIIAEKVKDLGLQYGRVDSTFHYHQVMHKKSSVERKIEDIQITVEKSEKEKRREYTMQALGIIKYTEPTPELVDHVNKSIAQLTTQANFSWTEFKGKVRKINPQWISYIEKPGLLRKLASKLLNKK